MLELPRGPGAVEGLTMERMAGECMTKLRFKTGYGARAAPDRLNSRADTFGVLEVYRCRSCGLYHLATARPRVRRKVAR